MKFQTKYSFEIPSIKTSLIFEIDRYYIHSYLKFHPLKHFLYLNGWPNEKKII